MATSAEASRVAHSEEWSNRIEMFLVKQCIAVMYEAGTVANHAERAAYAANVLERVVDYSSVPIGVATATSVLNVLDETATDSGVSDAVIWSAIQAQYDAYAGITEAGV